MAKKDLDTLNTYLGDKPFLLGNEISMIDAILFGVFGGISCIPVETPLKELANQYPHLKRHSLRILETYYQAS